ncbi:MAG: response regulator [Gemmatimonadetes bacterium]|jgi:CheY-like chemotaxis protein|nr:response regulator [Gemmatimonadota bacterium]MBT6149223.1 response regulator [Gemmatimonadota bacterium]MBT7860140.1 response regulator [Gemmatimonadota bacterium]
MVQPDESVEDLFASMGSELDPGPAKKPVASPRGAKRVLIVDDSLMIRKVLRTVITGLGHRVDEAENGAKALGAAMINPPNLVFLDLHMPEMDGPQMLDKWSRHPVLGKVPIVLLTSETDPGMVKEAARFGVTDYLSKPARPQKIREKVQKYLT